MSSENIARRLSNLAMWHRAAKSYVVEDFGRAPLIVQLDDEAETCGALPEKVFNSQKVDFSAGEKFFDGACRANLLGSARSQRTHLPFCWLKGPCLSLREIMTSCRLYF